MRCCDVEALWDELRGCEERGSDPVFVHLKACTDCRNVFAANDALLRAIEKLPAIDPPDGLCAKILEQIQLACGSQVGYDTLTRIDTPIGSVYVVFNEAAVTYLAPDQGDAVTAVIERIERRLRRKIRESETPAWLNALMAEYFQNFTVDLKRLDLTLLSAFEAKALQLVAQIPPGSVRSYGWVAKELGQPNAARAVGRAMARNPIALFLPCHRVVDANGSLHQYAYGVHIKARLLELEGYKEGA